MSAVATQTYALTLKAAATRNGSVTRWERLHFAYRTLNLTRCTLGAHLMHTRCAVGARAVLVGVCDVACVADGLPDGLECECSNAAHPYPRQARETGICPIREELYAQCFDELIRQVTINCAERGLLLLRVRDELRMTIAAYQVGGARYLRLQMHLLRALHVCYRSTVGGGLCIAANSGEAS